MKCQNCKKREATVHLTEIKNNAKQEMHLCESCAAEKGLPGKAHFSMSELLAGIAGAAQAQKRKGKELRCPACDLALSQFQATGRLGCPECYTAFKGELLPLLEKIHDSTQHLGRIPRSAPEAVALQKEVRALQVELKRAVQREDYKQAAALRDQLRSLEERLKAPLPGTRPTATEAPRSEG